MMKMNDVFDVEDLEGFIDRYAHAVYFLADERLHVLSHVGRIVIKADHLSWLLCSTSIAYILGLDTPEVPRIGHSKPNPNLVGTAVRKTVSTAIPL
jgi:hypothetical protein